MKTLTRVTVLWTLLCLATTAYADTAVTTIVSDVVQVAGYALGLLLLTLITLVANKLRQKYNIEVPAIALDALHKLIDQGIAYAEEQGNKAAVPLAGNEKLNLAASFILKIAGDDKALVALGEEKLKQLIEARLNQTRPLIDTKASNALIDSATPAVAVNTPVAVVTPSVTVETTK